MSSPNMNEILTTTLQNRSGVLADNYTTNNALLGRMKKKGSYKPVSGGRTIVQELAYQGNQGFQRYSGYEELNIKPSDVFTASEYDWKQASVPVTISGLEGDIQNTGEDQVIDLLESRIENAEGTFINELSLDAYSNGTASGGKQMGGLALLVADNPTSGVVGGIDRALWSFWRNQVYSGLTDGGAAVSAANIGTYMTTLYLRCSRGNDHPDLWIADNNYYQFYMSSLQAIQRITSDEMASLGFTSLKFMNSDVVFDGGIGGGCPTNHMYALNTKYIKYRPHKNRNMVPLPQVSSINQDATVKLLVWAGNMSLSNAQLQGVLKP